MDTRMIVADYRLRQWAKIVQECSASGLTIKAYCEEVGIRQHQYYYMKKKLREAACGELATVQSKSPEMATQFKNDNPIVWGEVSTKAMTSPTTHVSGSINITRGSWTVTVEPGFDSGTLTEALKAVNRICC